MHGRTIFPSGASEIVLVGGCGENQLDVAPREVRVGVAGQSRDARDNGSRGGSPAEVVVVTIGILGRQDAADSAENTRAIV